MAGHGVTGSRRRSSAAGSPRTVIYEALEGRIAVAALEPRFPPSASMRRCRLPLDADLSDTFGDAKC